MSRPARPFLLLSFISYISIEPPSPVETFHPRVGGLRGNGHHTHDAPVREYPPLQTGSAAQRHQDSTGDSEANTPIPDPKSS